MDVFGLFTGIVKPVFEGIFKWKDNQDKMEITRKEFELMQQKMSADIEIRLAEEMRKPTSEFRDFMLKYEGSASEQEPWVRSFRSSVRPIITYWALIIITLIMFGVVGGDDFNTRLESIPDPLWDIFLAIFGFWFGGRAAMQVVETWKSGEVKKQEASSRGRVEAERYKAKAARAEAVKAKAQNKDKVGSWDDDDDDFWGD